MYYLIEPEVTGRFGDESKVDTTIHPPVIHKLEVVFDGWLGDDLIELFPYFLVSENLKQEFDNCDLTGFDLEKIVVTKSMQFNELYEDKDIPQFYWFKVSGKPLCDDFWITENHLLAVSVKGMDVLTKCHIRHSDIEKA